LFDGPRAYDDGGWAVAKPREDTERLPETPRGPDGRWQGIRSFDSVAARHRLDLDAMRAIWTALAQTVPKQLTLMLSPDAFRSGPLCVAECGSSGQMEPRDERAPPGHWGLRSGSGRGHGGLPDRTAAYGATAMRSSRSSHEGTTGHRRGGRTTHTHAPAIAASELFDGREGVSIASGERRKVQRSVAGCGGRARTGESAPLQLTTTKWLTRGERHVHIAALP
jgi:hypothetical protein